jgi:hypothetical protein
VDRVKLFVISHGNASHSSDMALGVDARYPAYAGSSGRPWSVTMSRIWSMSKFSLSSVIYIIGISLNDVDVAILAARNIAPILSMFPWR